MLKQISFNNFSYMSNWHGAFGRSKDVAKQRQIPSFTHSLLNFSNIHVSPETATMHSLEAAQWKQEYRIEWYPVTEVNPTSLEAWGRWQGKLDFLED